MQRHETFSFGDEFRLEIKRDNSGRKALTLYRDDEVIENSKGPTLNLLHLLLRHPKEVLSDDYILDALWPGSGAEIIDKNISFLRSTLADEPRSPLFIETVRGQGYRFLMPVVREGGGIDAYPAWTPARFHELMQELKRGPETDTEDVRIVATGLNSSVEEFGIRALLQKHLRVKILFINPANKPLINARYSVRQDKSIARCLQELNQQIEDLEILARKYPVANGSIQTELAKSVVRKGELEFGVSDVMPCGVVVHTREWALMGILLAHDTFTAGPMLEMSRGSEPWLALELDWRERWQAFIRSQNASVNGAIKPVKVSS